MMSDGMRRALQFLLGKFGEYGRNRWAWLMQAYDVMPWDDVPEAMELEVYGKRR